MHYTIEDLEERIDELENLYWNSKTKEEADEYQSQLDDCALYLLDNYPDYEDRNLDDFLLGYEIECQYITRERWQIVFSHIIQVKDRYFQITVYDGATECQDSYILDGFQEVYPHKEMKEVITYLPTK